MLQLVEYMYMGAVSIGLLAILIFVHELGHFLVAKWRGVAVLDFSIGFGKILWKRKYRETSYALRAIPLGGYVRMLGDDPFEKEKLEQGKAAEASQDDSVLEQHAETQIDPALYNDRSKWFLNKPVLDKALIVLAGPVFNLLFAFLISVFAFLVYGKATDINEPIIGAVFPKLPAEQAGIVSGDKVLSINGQPLSTWEELSRTVRGSKGQEMTLVIERQEESGNIVQVEKKVTGTADNEELDLLEGRLGQGEVPYRIGIGPKTGREPVGIGEAIYGGSMHVWGVCVLTGRVLHAMVTGIISPTKVLGGPLAVFTGGAQSAKQGFESTLSFMVLLSVSLAIFNLLPIPVLDGGHLVFFMIEALKGSPLSVRWQAAANQIGLALLLLLMVFAVSNDVFRLL